jgi:hypothetical protein
MSPSSLTHDYALSAASQSVLEKLAAQLGCIAARADFKASRPLESNNKKNGDTYHD